MLIRFDLAALKYLGVPFVHQGRNPDIGIDCVGLLRVAADDLGVSLCHHDSIDYDRNPANRQLESRLEAAFGKCASTLEPGCIVSIKYTLRARHVAIIGEHLDGLSIIHTDSHVSRVVSSRLDDRWRRRITGIYRMEVAA